MPLGSRVALFFAALLLFVLPFAHVTALRSLGLIGTFVAALIVYLRQQTPPLPLKAPLAFWLLVAIASLPTAIDPAYSFRELRSDIGYSIAVFFAFFVLTRDLGTLRLWRSVTALCTAVISAYAIVIYLREGHWRVGYQNALGEFATFLTTALPLLLTGLAGALAERSRLGKAALLAALGLALVAGTLGKSRALWMAAAVVFLVATVLWWLKAGRQRRLPVLVVVVVMTVAGAIATQISSHRGIQLLDTGSRAPIYRFAAENFVRQPLYGSGFGREANRSAYRKEFPHGRVLHSHDIVLSYGEQMGIWGILALAWLLGAPAWLFWRHWRSAQPALTVIGACGLALLAGLVLKNVTDMFFTGHLLLLFWAHTGILLGAAARSGAEAPSMNGSRP
jgi:O-antigen ligase